MDRVIGYFSRHWPEHPCRSPSWNFIFILCLVVDADHYRQARETGHGTGCFRKKERKNKTIPICQLLFCGKARTVFSVSGRWRQEDQELKGSLSYRVWCQLVSCETLSQKETKRSKKYSKIPLKAKFWCNKNFLLEFSARKDRLLQRHKGSWNKNHVTDRHGSHFTWVLGNAQITLSSMTGILLIFVENIRFYSLRAWWSISI